MSSGLPFTKGVSAILTTVDAAISNFNILKDQKPPSKKRRVIVEASDEEDKDPVATRDVVEIVDAEMKEESHESLVKGPSPLAMAAPCRSRWYWTEKEHILNIILPNLENAETAPSTMYCSAMCRKQLASLTMCAIIQMYHNM